MISFSILLLLAITHYICDFVIQPEEWNTNKDIDIEILIKHTLLYAFAFMPTAYMLFLDPWSTFLFVTVLALSHLIIDYSISKVVSFKEKISLMSCKIPNCGFYSLVGLESLLHYISLFAIYIYLKG